MTRNELKILQQLPLDMKIERTKMRICDAIYKFGADGLYIAYSGGKDSQVLRHLVKNINASIPAVFCNTGLELPEVVKCAEKYADEIIKPDMSFTKVIETYGYPVLSKVHATTIRKLRTQNISERYKRKLLFGDERGKMGMLPLKFHRLLETDYMVSEKCCDCMKKRPMAKYKKRTQRVPILGTMADESNIREIAYTKYGCNAFEGDNPRSQPLGFWTQQDILEYIERFSLEIPSVYGQIIQENGKRKLTGLQRTGCVFCAFGVYLEEEPNRFQQLKQTHPQLHDYCMRGGKHDENGKWIPHKGLGMKHVLSDLGVKYE